MVNNNLVGSMFAGCKIINKIGQGGMGAVYKATHTALDKTVCVKILFQDLAKDKRNLEFFLREARSAAKLDHPNIVHVYNFGRENGLYFIVMSYVDGKSLQDLVLANGPMPVKKATAITINLLNALNHAHCKGIIHRDIKPSNVLIDSNGKPHIVDFGLARSLSEEKELTQVGEMIGTAYFMSPEQCLAKKVDNRADLYAVGASFYYLLTGKYPFDGKTSVEVMHKHISDRVPDPILINSSIPTWAVAFINRLMKKKPEDRYQTAQEAEKELISFSTGKKNVPTPGGEIILDLSSQIKELGDPLETQNSDTGLNLNSEIKKISGNPQLQISSGFNNSYGNSDYTPDSDAAKVNYQPSSVPAEEIISSLEAKSNAEPEPKLEKNPPKKEQTSSVINLTHKIIKTITHFCLLFTSVLCFVLSGASGLKSGYLFSPFRTNLTSAGLFFVSGLIIMGLALILKPKETPYKHYFYLLLATLTAYVGGVFIVAPDSTEISAKILIALSMILQNTSSSLLIVYAAASFLIASRIYQFDSLFSKITSALLFSTTIILLFSYLKTGHEFLSINVWGISAILLSLLSVVYCFKSKNTILGPRILTILAAVSLFMMIMLPNIHRTADYEFKKQNKNIELFKAAERANPFVKFPKELQPPPPKELEEFLQQAKIDFYAKELEKLRYSLTESGGFIVFSFFMPLLATLCVCEKMFRRKQKEQYY